LLPADFAITLEFVRFAASNWHYSFILNDITKSGIGIVASLGFWNCRGRPEFSVDSKTHSSTPLSNRAGKICWLQELLREAELSLSGVKFTAE